MCGNILIHQTMDGGKVSAVIVRGAMQDRVVNKSIVDGVIHDSLLDRTQV